MTVVKHVGLSMDNLDYALYEYRSFIADLLDSCGLKMAAKVVRNPKTSQSEINKHVRELEIASLSNSEIRERMQIEGMSY